MLRVLPRREYPLHRLLGRHRTNQKLLTDFAGTDLTSHGIVGEGHRSQES